MAEAHQGQVISGHHKDNYYRDYLKNLIIDFINSVTKEKKWMKHIKDISVLADIVYFTFTTLSGNQTLGEEYNNILLVNKDKRSLPSKFRSALMVVFHVILPHTIEKSTAYLSTFTLRNQEFTEDKRRKILNMIKIFGGFLKFLEKLNSMLFYLNGAYYHLSKRLTSVLYLQTRPLKFESAYRRTYSLLGWLMLLQSMIASCTYVYNAWKNSENDMSLFLYNLFGVNLLTSSSTDQPSSRSSLSSLSAYLLKNLDKRKKSPSNQASSDPIDSSIDNHHLKPNNFPSSSNPLPAFSKHHVSAISDSSTSTNTLPPTSNKSIPASIYSKNNQTALLNRRSCLLCYDQLHNATATFCGHVFCYQCITEWCVSKPECPVCKKEVKLSRLVFLKNFA